MNIAVTCISCGKKLSAPESLAGRRASCPKCGAPVDVPMAATVPQPAAAAPAPITAAARPPQMSRQVSDADLLDLGVGAPAAPTHGSLPVIHTQAPARSAGAKRRVSIPLIAAAVLVAVIGGAIGAWVFLGGKSGAGSDLRYLPDDPDFVVSANVSGMINSGAGQKI